MATNWIPSLNSADDFTDQEKAVLVVVVYFTAFMFFLLAVAGVFILVKHLIVGGRWKTFPVFMFYFFALPYIAFIATRAIAILWVFNHYNIFFMMVPYAFQLCLALV